MNDKTIEKDRIKEKLRTEYIGKRLFFFEKTTSTFDEAKKICVENGDVFCARTQTNGRGRLGRQWESQLGGVYFSVILIPEYDTQEVHAVTALCAVAVQRAISHYVPCKIKWPNDIVSESGKKLCGILTKLQYVDNDNYYINVGIGINANNDEFDKELVHAVSIKTLSAQKVDENELLCDCLAEMEDCLKKQNFEKIMDEYKHSCVTLGSRVRLLYADGRDSETGLCIDILNDGVLVVKNDDGTTKNVVSGEVSVRGIYGEKYV